MQNSVNAEMVQLARESRGMTQKDLAVASKLSQSTISKSERNEIRVSQDQLLAISRSLDYPVSFFEQQEPIWGFGVSGVFHRKRQSIPMLLQKRIQAEFNIRTIETKKLLEDIDIRHKNQFFPANTSDYGDDIEGAERVADLVRAKWNLPIGPIKNVIASIESAGGIVFKYDLGSPKMDAQSRLVDGLPPLFFAHKDVPPDRLRFTLAHEIGHIIMHSESPSGNIEGEANRFASAFLMPHNDIVEQLCPFTMNKAMALKAEWGVSIAALIMRACDLGVISASQKQRLFRIMSAAGIRKDEPVDIAEEEPRTLVRIIEVHRKTLGFSKSALCKHLCINETDFDARYSQGPILRIKKS